MFLKKFQRSKEQLEGGYLTTVLGCGKPQSKLWKRVMRVNLTNWLGLIRWDKWFKILGFSC